jgi:sec-independent protein translocase protein TatA
MGLGLFQPWHLLLILAVVLIVFGAGRLPEVGGALGRGIKEFKAGTAEALDAAPAPPPPPAAGAAPPAGAGATRVGDV